MSQRFKIWIALGYDFTSAMVAVVLAVLVRFNGQIPTDYQELAFILPAYASLSVALGLAFGLYKGLWRYTSLHEMMRILKTVTAAVALMTILFFVVNRLEGVSRFVLLATWFVHIAALSGARAFYRVLREEYYRRCNPGGRHIVLVGVNDAAEAYIRETHRRRTGDKVLALLDDDSSLKGKRIHGVPVVGTLASLEIYLEAQQKRRKEISTLVLSRNGQMNHPTLVGTARRFKLEVARLPDMGKLAKGERVTNIRPVPVEDLLGRAPIKLDKKPVKDMLTGKVVCITGAGGSIGSELCRQIALMNPQELLLIDNSEYALYEIHRELAASFPTLPLQALLIDVRNRTEVNTAFKTHKPQVVVHAAALKHVPLVEDNPCAGLHTNLIGTQNVADAANDCQAERFMMISTDKAVNPTNVMGASKRAAEIYCQNLKSDHTRYTTVRFGNVLGSRGSVVPLFTQQIKNGGPVTITDKRMTRFFMTIPEAVELTLQAASMGKGSEIFVLDMGEPIKIIDMAEQMIRLSGYEPYKDIDIREIGLRPGEKLYEELLHAQENLGQTQNAHIFLASARQMPSRQLQKHMKNISAAATSQDKQEAVKHLQAFVPEYKPAQNSPYK